MKRFIATTVLLFLVFLSPAVYVLLRFSWNPFDAAAFYSFLNLTAALILVFVTGAYVITTKRYVDVFVQDVKTRQTTQEEWEMRRFIANRLFSMGDGFIEIFFASKRELETWVFQNEAVIQSVSDLQRSALTNTRGTGVVPPAAESRATSLGDTIYIRYNERAKDYNWRAQVLLQQAKSLLPKEHCEEMGIIFQTLSRNFYSVEEGRAIIKDYEKYLPDVTRIVSDIHALAASKVTTTLSGKAGV